MHMEMVAVIWSLGDDLDGADDGPLMVWLMVMMEMELLVDDVALGDGGAMLEMP